MKINFTLKRILFLMLFFAASMSRLQAQCPNDGVFFQDITPTGVGSAAAGSFSCTYGGDIYSFSTQFGYTYVISTCGNAWDSQLTLRDDLTNVLAYDDDSSPCGSGASEITWVATYTGVAYVQVNEYNCITNTTCGSISVTQIQGDVVPGCTDPTALNYNSLATIDDGSCVFPTICDCAGTQHTIGVLSWIGDTFADNGAYLYQGQYVDFNCATWGYDCGDIVGAPVDDPYGVCAGGIPPNNGCIVEVLGCTDPLATNYNPLATADDGSCTYSLCSNLTIAAEQLPCMWNTASATLMPGVAFTPTYDGPCTISTLYLNLNGTEYPFNIAAPDNVSGSYLAFDNFTAGSTFSVYYTLSDGTTSGVFDFLVGDCLSDPLICDCAGNSLTIGVLNWIGDGFADNGVFQWAGQYVDFNCATWGYDCGDIAGAPAEDPYGVCSGNLPPSNGCLTIDVYGCTDMLANNYNALATVNDGSCTYDVYGCMDPTANNYDPAANIDNGSCTYTVSGCTDPSATNYNPLANVNDGSCIYATCSNVAINGVQTPCTQDLNGVLNPGMDFTYYYSGDCTVDSLVLVYAGLTYPFAQTAPANVSGTTFGLIGFPANTSFGVYIRFNDGTQSPTYNFSVADCSLDQMICDCSGNVHTIGVLAWLGDTYGDASAYTWDGVLVDFNCATWGYDCGDIVGAPVSDPYGVCAGNLPPNNGCSADVIVGCTDITANNYNPMATVNDGSCTYDVLGCTYPTANNYNPLATVDDGSCNFDVLGCTYPTASNYNPLATVDDGSCVFDVLGCTDAVANNYNPAATVDDGSCTYDVLGCTDSTANNYNPMATVNDGSCTYDVAGCTDPTANNYNPLATVNDGSCTYDIAGCMDPAAINYNPLATVDDGSCVYSTCDNFDLTAQQTACVDDGAGNLTPGVDFTFVYAGSCTVDSMIIVLGGTVFSLPVTAPDNVSGSVFNVVGFPQGSTFTASYLLNDGTLSPSFEFSVGDCSQDPVICDCDGNEHTIGVLSWLGDTFADDGAFTWAGVTVNFNCATWGYDCGDIAGAPAEDPYGVCSGNLPPFNGCFTNVTEHSDMNALEAYPNPTSGSLTLISHSGNEMKQIRVYDQSGQLLLSEQRLMMDGVSQLLDLSALAAGTYHVQLVGTSDVSNISVIIQK